MKGVKFRSTVRRSGEEERGGAERQEGIIGELSPTDNGKADPTQLCSQSEQRLLSGSVEALRATEVPSSPPAG